jgi:hypothetical protein
MSKVTVIIAAVVAVTIGFGATRPQPCMTKAESQVAGTYAADVYDELICVTQLSRRLL